MELIYLQPSHSHGAPRLTGPVALEDARGRGALQGHAAPRPSPYLHGTQAFGWLAGVPEHVRGWQLCS